MHLQLHHLNIHDLERLLRSESIVGNLQVPSHAVPGFLVMAALIDLNAGRPALWHSPFLFACPRRSLAVGSGGFKGPPNGGRVDVGYGVVEEHRGKGVATAGLALIVERAFLEPDVDEIYAESAVTNRPSAKALEKNGFVRIGSRESQEDGEMDCWRHAKPTSG